MSIFYIPQSVPALQLKWTLQNAKELSDPIGNQLVTLNAALTKLDEESGFSSTPGAYNVESIERPRKRVAGIVKRLSYVEHSYKQLTNDTYSSNCLHPVKATRRLDTWVKQ